MVLYEVFSHAKYTRYKTNIFSKASLVQAISITLSLLGPFLIAYFMGGFWIQEKICTEKPIVNFQYRFLAILETDTSFYLSSSFESLNEIYGNNYRPFDLNVNDISDVLVCNSFYFNIFDVKVREIDSNDDNYKDYVKINIFINGIDPTNIIKNVRLIFVFNNSLSVSKN
jgi:hypothetical protein